MHMFICKHHVDEMLTHILSSRYLSYVHVMSLSVNCYTSLLLYQSLIRICWPLSRCGGSYFTLHWIMGKFYYVEIRLPNKL